MLGEVSPLIDHAGERKGQNVGGEMTVYLLLSGGKLDKPVLNSYESNEITDVFDIIYVYYVCIIMRFHTLCAHLLGVRSRYRQNSEAKKLRTIQYLACPTELTHWERYTRKCACTACETHAK